MRDFENFSFFVISITFVFGGENVGKIFGSVGNMLYLCTQKSKNK